MQRIRKGDQVIVLAGKDKGRQGVVLKVFPDQGRLIVEGVNIVCCHVKPQPGSGKPGGIQKQERSIHVSNVALYNSVSGRGERLGVRTLEDGRKVRYFKSDNEVVDTV